MSNRLNLDELERHLQALIEVRLANLLPGNKTEDIVVHQLAAAVRSNIDYDDPESDFPSSLELRVNPAAVAAWLGNVELVEELTAIIRTIASESGFELTSSPMIRIRGDASLEPGDIKIEVPQAGMSLAETHNLPPGESAIEPDGTFPQSAFLIVGGVKVFPLDRSVINIGRRSDNHLAIDDPRVSRYHAQLRAIRGRFVLFDLNSTGGTFVNGQRASQSVLYPGDVISLAGLSIIFGQDSPPPGLRPTGTEPLKPQAPNDRPTVAVKKSHREDIQD